MSIKGNTLNGKGLSFYPVSGKLECNIQKRYFPSSALSNSKETYIDYNKKKSVILGTLQNLIWSSLDKKETVWESLPIKHINQLLKIRFIAIMFYCYPGEADCNNNNKKTIHTEKMLAQNLKKWVK